MMGIAGAVSVRMSRWAPGLHVSALSWSLGGSVIAQASTFAMSFVLARIIGRVAFGEWAALQSTVGTVSGIAQLSMAVTATKFVAELRRTRADRVGRILGVCSALTLTTGLAAALSVILSAPWFASAILHAPHLVGALRISALSLFLLTVTGYQIGALAGLERFRALALLGALQGFATAVLVAALALIRGLDGALAGYALAAALTWVVTHRVLVAECRAAGIRVGYAHLREEMRVLAHFAVPATLAGIAGMVAVWLSTLLIVRQPGGYAEMASFSAANALRGAVLFAPTVVMRVSAPVLAGLVGAGALGQHKDALRGSALVAAFSAALVAAPIATAAPWLLGLFGKSFRSSSAAVMVMAMSGVAEAAGQALNQQFLSRNRMWWNLVMAGGRGTILVAATYLLVPSGGALGAAWAVFIAYCAAVAFVVAFSAATDPAPAASDGGGERHHLPSR